jgi:hypothetical protein
MIRLDQWQHSACGQGDERCAPGKTDTKTAGSDEPVTFEIACMGAKS